MSEDQSSGGKKHCPFCAEEIQAEAVVCRFCSHDLTPKESHHGCIKGIGIAACVVIGFFVLLMVVGSGSSRGTNYDLYSAIALYGATTTHDQADAIVDEIAKNSEVTHSKAEKLAIACVQNHIEMSMCVKVSYIDANMERLKSRGVVP